jgi:hypothetical protein
MCMSFQHSKEDDGRLTDPELAEMFKLRVATLRGILTPALNMSKVDLH